MRAAFATVVLLLGGCAAAPETHGQWYIGVGAVVFVAGVCFLVGEASNKASQHTRPRDSGEAPR